MSCSRTIERMWVRSIEMAPKLDEKQQLVLKRRKDGTLTMLTGNPVRAGELVPGRQYTVITE